MTSRDSFPKPELVDLTGDSDDDDYCSPIDDIALVQPAIKVEPVEDKANLVPTDLHEHSENATAGLSHMEPTVPTMSMSILPSNSAELGTTQADFRPQDDASDEPIIVSGASSSFDSTSGFKFSNNDSQQVPADFSTDAPAQTSSGSTIEHASDPNTNSAFQSTSFVDVSSADHHNEISPDMSVFQQCGHNSREDQHSAIPEQIHYLPELAITELPGDDNDGDDGIDNLTPEEALLVYNQNKSHFNESDDDHGESETHQNDSYISQQNIPAYEDAEMIDWNAALNEDPTDNSAQAAANFARLKKKYSRKKADGTATGEDDIQFIAAEVAEKKRLDDLERSQRLIVEDELVHDGLSSGYQDEDSLFIPEVPDRPESPKIKKSRAGPKPRNRLSAQETREAMAVGNAPSATRKRHAPANSNDPPKKKRDTKNGTTKPTKKRTKQPVLSNLNSLGRSNIVQDAQANADKPDMPTFSSKNKTIALQELIASIPSAEDGSQASDKAAVLAATKKFKGRGSVKSDGQGGWKLKGMRSSLYHHQLLGAAFLRDRENGTQRPYGGLVCDEMGFGKTIQMIANILDGKPDEGSPEKTTLIVAPACLLNQWMVELDKHVEPGKLARVIRYHSGARLHSSDPVADLKEYDIILTTYGEIQRSYPACEPPKHLVSEERKNAWWEKFYKENVGPLHRIKYLRIVLDEAHQIKNHTSKTSIAVRALTGTFRWAITGTPILNYIEELFPYFSFLKVPHTGDFPTFCHNYCQNRSRKEPVNMSRIHNILRAIMLRRTHVDTIFNAPIVKLPGISHTTYSLEFNDVERAIYNTVKKRFIQNINKIYRAGELNGGYSNILAMIHHLRMLCSHVLLCQDMLKQLFDAADIEVLWRLTAKEAGPTPANNQDTTISVLRKMIHSKANTIRTSQSTDTRVGSAEILESDDPEELNRGSDFGIYFKFRRFLEELSKGKAWTELHLRSMCGKCKLPPDEPICTSCFHVYCKECLGNMEYERQQKKEDKIACIECGTQFEETSPCAGLKALGFNSEEVAKRVQRARNERTTTEKRGRLRGKITSASPESEDEEEDIDWIELGGVTLPSAKLAATKAAILNWRERCPTEKIIVYTQFLGMVRLLAKVCRAEGWEFVQFTGKMSLTAREKAINQFAKDENISIMICTLKAGGVGLNLNMASKVIILDLWFNSSIEAQAYCRAFRIGQERKVEVLRFVIQNSIDEDLIHMQDRKDVEVTGAIGPDSHSKRATISQLLGLFGEVVEDGQNEFILVEDESQVDDDADVDIINRLPPRPF